jgi:hypothetical protein
MSPAIKEVRQKIRDLMESMTQDIQLMNQLNYQLWDQFANQLNNVTEIWSKS